MAAPTFAPALGLVDAAGVPISATNPLSVSLVAGGGGTAVSIADGADVALGSLADSSSALTVNGLLKAIKALLGAPLVVTGSFYQATQPVSIAAPIAVTGTFWQATQPVSGTVAVTNSNLDAALSTLATKAQLPTTLGITTKAASLSVAIASDQVGTAGSASTTVMSVQGIASMTAVQVTPPAGIGQQTLANSISVGFNSNQVGTAGSPATTVLSVQGVASGTGLTVVGVGAAGSAVSGNPVLMAGTDGTIARTQRTDTTGRPPGSSITYISTATTTTIKSSAGVLRRIVIGYTVAAISLAIYDANGGTTNQKGGLTVAGSVGGASIAVEFNAEFTNGITIVSTGATVAVSVIFD